MFDSGLGFNASVDSLEQELLASEMVVARERARQIAIVRNLDFRQVAIADGCRSMVEWVASRLDVSHSIASELLFLAKANDVLVEQLLSHGEIGLQRAVLMVRLRQAGASDEQVIDSRGYDLAGVERLAASHRRMTASEEASRYEDRHLVIQPNLDESSWRIWGQLPGSDGQLVEKALMQRSDELPTLPGEGRGERMADALTSICLDSITEGSEGRAVTVAEVFVDASLAASSRGEAGVTLSSGLRAGPNTLSEILCTGQVRVIFQGDDGRPVGATDLSEAIPPRTRGYVWIRDRGVCTIDGCRSRYRLQPHHIHERSAGGDNHPDNLTLLCWFHHHVAIHGLGMILDPTSPPQRRRLLRRNHRGPPLH
ncbi:MAG TPA: HNH endonuclease signature motif containing protein [Acidimicrobiia bacterium]|nr:HNH endonuclease signature motif containing protein [Acidimicrobiia bacterium]